MLRLRRELDEARSQLVSALEKEREIDRRVLLESHENHGALKTFAGLLFLTKRPNSVLDSAEQRRVERERSNLSGFDADSLLDDVPDWATKSSSIYDDILRLHRRIESAQARQDISKHIRDRTRRDLDAIRVEHMNLERQIDTIRRAARTAKRHNSSRNEPGTLRPSRTPPRARVVHSSSSSASTKPNAPVTAKPPQSRL